MMTNIAMNCRRREEGKLSQSEVRQRITEMRDETNKSNIESVSLESSKL